MKPLDPMCGDGASLRAAYAYVLDLPEPESGVDEVAVIDPHITPLETGSEVHQYDGSPESAGGCSPTGSGVLHIDGSTASNRPTSASSSKSDPRLIDGKASE